MTQTLRSALGAHVLGWLIFLSLPLIFMTGPAEEDSITPVLLSPYYWLFNFTFLFVFYFNVSFLIPRYFLKHKYGLYFTFLFILFNCILFLRPFDNLFSQMNRQPRFSERRSPPPPERRPPPRFRPDSGMPPRQPEFGHLDMVSIFLFITVVAMGLTIQIAQQWRVTEKRVVQAEADKATAELSFLKAQINPHFLFNTLNNIYSLAVMQSPNTATSIMKLSNIMRHVTDDVSEDFVSLSSEVTCIRDYIDLQKLRLSKNTQIDFSVSGNLEQKSIAPLILMTFIENVFKYGISNRHPAQINIKLKAEENLIQFSCQNQIFETSRNTERTGIGLANTRQRLAHLYPDKHTLNISSENNLFTVTLTLQA